jgi:hypothetical protein
VSDDLARGLFEEAGFTGVCEVSRSRSLFGRYTHVRATAPRHGDPPKVRDGALLASRHEGWT